MKKKFITLILCFLCVMSNCLIVFADDNEVNEFSLNTCLAETSKYFDLSEYNYIYIYGDYRTDAHIYLFPKDAVLVRQNANNYGAYWYSPYLYDENTNTVKYCGFSYEVSIKAGTTNVYNSVTPSSLIAFGYTDDYGNWLNTTNAPCCVDLNYALLYYQTMDAHYLENVSDFITLNAPKNVSMYLASDENKIYLYYENDDCANPLYTFTHIHYDYSYVDLDGDINTVSSYDDEILFSERNQYGFDLTPLLEYDSSILIGHLYNIEYPFGDAGAEPFTSNRVVFMYTPSNKEVRIIYTDENNNEISSTSNIITDYRNYRDSYTGGVIIEIPDFNNSFGNDFDLLGGIFDGFGLIGNSGLIALIASLFTFIPAPIIVLWTAGVSIILIVALFKLLVH